MSKAQSKPLRSIDLPFVLAGRLEEDAQRSH